MLNRHLLGTNHQLRGKIDEVRVLQRKVEELQRVNGGLVVLNRRLGRRNGQVVQENDMLRALHKGRRR
jgi:FtsZ-binding cell division protein ZapB